MDGESVVRLSSVFGLFQTVPLSLQYRDLGNGSIDERSVFSNLAVLVSEVSNESSGFTILLRDNFDLNRRNFSALWSTMFQKRLIET